MEDVFKACPFCGSRDITFTDEWYDDGVRNMLVICNNCGAMGRREETPCDDDGNCYSEGDDRYDELHDELVAEWNKRSDTAGDTAEMVDISEKILECCRKMGNMNTPEGFMSNVDKLAAKLQEFKGQIQREKADLSPKKTREGHQHARVHVPHIESYSIRRDPSAGISIEECRSSTRTTHTRQAETPPMADISQMLDTIISADPSGSGSCGMDCGTTAPSDNPSPHVGAYGMGIQSMAQSLASVASAGSSGIDTMDGLPERPMPEEVNYSASEAATEESSRRLSDGGGEEIFTDAPEAPAVPF